MALFLASDALSKTSQLGLTAMGSLVAIAPVWGPRDRLPSGPRHLVEAWSPQGRLGLCTHKRTAPHFQPPARMGALHQQTHSHLHPN